MGYISRVDLNPICIYECLCDRTRLRLLHLLLQGPLCVCHFQEILQEPQVKISKHLAYLKNRGLVSAERCGQWMVYRLPTKPPALLQTNLACLQDCLSEDPGFCQDLARRRALLERLGADCPPCLRRKESPCLA